ncbi:MAG TPA: cytochrome c biogenesis protein DipZ [Mycobacteriales bacterium]|nr:cytochrome c biogenesis protein DipZ [Mycobacteriales bacterium]
MYVLVVVGLLAGVITSISPCVLPVLPVVLTASATRSGDRERPASGSTGTRAPAGRTSSTRVAPATAGRNRWRPYGVVAGLVVSFSASTLFGSLVLSALHLPQDLLRDAGIAVLVVIGLSLVVPRFGELLERPFARLPRRTVNPDGNGFGLGLGLGLLYVPCAGPVLAAIAVVGATHHIGFRSVVLTGAFGVGVGLPLLALALAGDAVARRTGILRRRARSFRLTGGIAMILVAAAVGLNLTDGLQRNVPGYTSALQKSVEQNSTATGQLHRLTTSGHSGPGANTDSGSGAGAGSASGGEGTCTEGGQTLENCGPAPELTGITGWLNTPGNQPLSLAGLRGKVVLIDFWTYSCINCQRTLPHVEAWYRDYHKDGFDVIGVHTPEFAFEHVRANVRSRAGALGVKYPVAIDNNYATWNAYSNQYWPAEYLVDSTGVIRHVSFGEGDYDGTETQIRQLLADAHPNVTLSRPSGVADTTPTEQQTAETYLGYKYPQRVTGDKPTHDRAAAYRFPASLTPDTFALSGTWTDRSEAATAGAGAKLELSFQARDVYLVLGGTGTVTVRVNGTTTSVLHVTGVPRLYTLAHTATARRGLLTLDVTPGVAAYDFTFG